MTMLQVPQFTSSVHFSDPTRCEAMFCQGYLDHRLTISDYMFVKSTILTQISQIYSRASMFQSVQIGTLATAISHCPLPSTANLYVPSSSYAVEFPTPFNDPTVASEGCTSNPESDVPELRIRRSKTRRLDRKSDEL